MSAQQPVHHGKSDRIDYAHPDVRRARAAAYTLLLQWRREREAKRKELAQPQKHACESQNKIA
jgi:hypothetical protein